MFFSLGACAAAINARWNHWIDANWPALLAAFVLCLAVIAAAGQNWPDWAVLLPVGALSLPALHGAVRRCRGAPAAALLWLGRYSFAIYLFNTLCIGFAKGVLLRMVPWRAPYFAEFAVVLMAAGVFGPILLKRFALRRFGTLDRLTS